MVAFGAHTLVKTDKIQGTEMIMNEYEIDHMVFVAQTDMPEVLPYARYLADWRDTVNANSDGWAYWRAGSKCADKLSGLLQEAKNSLIGRGQMPPRELFEKALTPIKTCATKHRLTAPELAIPQEQDQRRGMGM